MKQLIEFQTVIRPFTSVADGHGITLAPLRRLFNLRRVYVDVVRTRVECTAMPYQAMLKAGLTDTMTSLLLEHKEASTLVPPGDCVLSETWLRHMLFSTTSTHMAQIADHQLEHKLHVWLAVAASTMRSLGALLAAMMGHVPLRQRHADYRVWCTLLQTAAGDSIPRESELSDAIVILDTPQMQPLKTLFKGQYRGARNHVSSDECTASISR